MAAEGNEPGLLTGAEGPPVEVLNAQGRAPIVLVCEHASRFIPSALGALGLDEAAQLSHAAWDIGARDLAVALSERLDAPLVAARVSRLVYDCNRPPEAPSAMPARVETIDIPGNANLSPAERGARVAAVFEPFTAALEAVLDSREAPALVTVHSFTPTWFGRPREVEIGILHDSDARLADAMLASAAAHTGRRVARNAPYGPQDGVTYTLKRHGIARGLANVMLEIRNDLLGSGAAADAMAQVLAEWLEDALARVTQQAGEVQP